MSFLDLKNVFESVCHQYLFDILQYIKLPSVISYISYQLLFKTVSICVQLWEHYNIFYTPRSLPGLYLLFNLVINPLLAYLSTSEYCGYSAQLQAVNSIGLPPMEAPIYVLRPLWSDSSDDSPTRWYRANVISYHCDGSCDLVYNTGDTEQSVNFYNVDCLVLHDAGRYISQSSYIVLIYLLPSHQPLIMLLLFCLKFAIHQCIEQRDLLMT